MLSYLRHYWILNAKEKIKNYIHHCIKCFRTRARTRQKVVGELPRHRVTQHRAFLHVGVDYAGPILAKPIKGRGYNHRKCYIAVFVCFSTKAIHIELVPDYTSDSFIAALKRLVARRGLCSDLYSDCGTNFVGANNQFKSKETSDYLL